MKSKKDKVKEPEFLYSALNNPMPNYRVLKLSKSENFIVRIISFILGGFVGLIFYSGLFKVDGFPTNATYISDGVIFIVVGLITMRFLMKMYIDRKIKKRNNIIKQQFNEMLESLSSSLSAGSNVNNAFKSVLEDLKMQYSDKDYIVIEVKEIIDAMNQNIPIEEMLRDFAGRTGNDDIDSFADVFEICYRKGGDLKSVIGRTHNVISEKMEIADEIETKLTSNKLQHNVMSLMPIAVVAMLKLTNPAFAANFATLSGVIVNTIAIGIFVCAYKYGQKIVDIKE